MKHPINDDICSDVVTGRLFDDISGAFFLRRAKALIEDEQLKPSPDNLLLGFLCDAVRLWREHEDKMRGCK